MIKQSILLFVFFTSTKPFAINNDASSSRLYQRFTRSVSLSAPSIIQINNESTEWPLNENDSIRNDLLIGQCGIRDQRVHTDDILVENSGPSTLNGTIEIYVNSPITCVKVEDQIGSGAIPSYNSGGTGYNFVFIDVQCRYGKGFHFKIHIFGETNTTTNTDIV